MSVWIGALLVHLLYDFHWQGDFVAREKCRNRFVLFIHSLTWALLIYAVLAYFGLASEWKFVMLLGTHYIIDAMKCDDVLGIDQLRAGLWLDQTLHLATLALAILA